MVGDFANKLRCYKKTSLYSGHKRAIIFITDREGPSWPGVHFNPAVRLKQSCHFQTAVHWSYVQLPN